MYLCLAGCYRFLLISAGSSVHLPRGLVSLTTHSRVSFLSCALALPPSPSPLSCRSRFPLTAKTVTEELTVSRRNLGFVVGRFISSPPRERERETNRALLFAQQSSMLGRNVVEMCGTWEWKQLTAHLLFRKRKKRYILAKNRPAALPASQRYRRTQQESQDDIQPRSRCIGNKHQSPYVAACTGTGGQPCSKWRSL